MLVFLSFPKKTWKYRIQISLTLPLILSIFFPVSMPLGPFGHSAAVREADSLYSFSYRKLKKYLFTLCHWLSVFTSFCNAFLVRWRVGDRGTITELTYLLKYFGDEWRFVQFFDNLMQSEWAELYLWADSQCNYSELLQAAPMILSHEGVNMSAAYHLQAFSRPITQLIHNLEPLCLIWSSVLKSRFDYCSSFSLISISRDLWGC